MLRYVFVKIEAASGLGQVLLQKFIDFLEENFALIMRNLSSFPKKQAARPS
jgi:hypothetical protein